MAEKNMERAEELLNTIKTERDSTARNEAVRELIHLFSPSLSEMYSALGGPAEDDLARRNTLFQVFRETLADNSALQSAEVFDRALAANLTDKMKTAGYEAGIPQDNLSTTQIVNVIAEDSAGKEETPEEEPELKFGFREETAKPEPEKRFDPKTGEPLAEVEPQVYAKRFDPMTGEPLQAEEPSEPKEKPQKRFDPMTGKPIAEAESGKETVKAAPEPAEEARRGLPVWAKVIPGILGVLVLAALILFGMRSCAPSANNGAPEEEINEPAAEETAEPEQSPEPTPEITPEPTPEPTPEGPVVIGTATVKVDKLNLREGPNTDSPTHGQAQSGRTYDVYETVSDGTYTWYRIDDDLWFADRNGDWVTFERN